ncbi:NUDIX hydrolase [Pseudofrankia sp. BMG5.36]|uniref:NUDIX hydrolase n=1 Tax=Pseudofrankia sp. BMG5.36 TaxID=1834512 RepID=UPI0008D9D509|nr:NUDIX hydrolase [Pseudofrankia sp. BMG5.36]OHV49313.1 NUDIX hydrolase [Pseudofrankia sp. BMG5.36]
MSPAPCHSVSVGAAVINGDGQILTIQRRDNAHWELPGGVLELHEDIHHGLRREVEEETGYHVQPEALTGVYKNMRIGVVALVFRCRITGGAARTSDETSAVRWMSPTEVENHMDQAYAVRLLDALRDGPPAIRSHDGRSLIVAG